MGTGTTRGRRLRQGTAQLHPDTTGLVGTGFCRAAAQGSAGLGQWVAVMSGWVSGPGEGTSTAEGSPWRNHSTAEPGVEDAIEAEETPRDRPGGRLLNRTRGESVTLPPGLTLVTVGPTLGPPAN